LIIGTGFSGLAMAIQLKEKGIHDFVILEKAKEVGGTWRENTYPGAECDVPSALYSFSFEPYLHWEYKWSMQPQILEYIKHVTQKYDLYRHIQFEQEVTAAEWKTSESNWQVTTKNNTHYTAQTVISAIGQLHHPSTPNFAGKDTFEGPNWHSAQWNHDVPLAGKTIGVIGNAASAVQFIPEIAKTAKKLIVFQRSANWMLPKQDRAYKNWEKKLVATFPFLLKMYRLRLWLLGGGLFFLMKKGNGLLRKIYQKQTVGYIKENIKDPNTIEALTPNYPMGAKRVLFSDTYYPALARPNVELATGGVQRITPKGVVADDGQEQPVDILVYATGFKTNPFLLGLDIRGKAGKSIKDYWKEGPKNYLGMSMEHFPNFFMMYGPNTNLGHNSIIVMSEAQANYIAQCVVLLQDKQATSMEVKSDVLEDYHLKTQQRLNDMIWATVEDSWYKSANGNIPNNYPGRTMEYIRITKRVDVAAYEFQ
ncbi:MAG: NAD(P)/FAD-dependent oxidoreductase, partial [Bacteroidota bacterium]